MTDYAGSWHDEGETPVTSDRTSRLAAFLAKARANAGVPSPAVSPEPRRFLSSTEEPRVPEPVDDNTATSATRPLTILSARVSPGAETADPGGAVPDATQPHATVGSTSETRHETMSRAGRNSTATATERTTPPPAADHSAQATAVSASDSGIGLANHRTDTTSTGTRPKAQPARPTPKPPTGGGRPVAPPLGEMLVEQK